MVTNLKKRHCVVPVVVFNRRNQLLKRLSDEGVKCIVVPYGSFMHSSPSIWWKRPIKYIIGYIKYRLTARQSLKGIESKLNLPEIDLIHTNINRVDIGGKLARRYGIPHIQHIREFGDLDFSCWSYINMPGAYISSYSDATIAVSDSVMKYWIEHKGLSRDKCLRIYDGIDQSSFCVRHERSSVGLHIVMTGTLLEGKGQMALIRALACLDDKIKPYITADIVGGGSSKYKSKLERAISASSLQSNVRLLGHIDNIAEILPQYDVGIVGSRAEGFGRVTIEYMASGLAVIATSSGANRELLRDDSGDFGFYFEFGDYEALASQIQILYSNPRALTEAARRGVIRSKAFTCEANADSVYQLYRKVISGNQCRAEATPTPIEV